MTRTPSITILAVTVALALAGCNHHDHDHAADHDHDKEHAAAAAPEPAAAPVEDESITRAKQLAEQVARAMIKLSDAGEYGSIHDNADDFFRAAVTRDEFIKKSEAVLTPLGARKSLELASATYTTKAPGAPDGKYVILQFNSSFENKAEAVETVSLHEAEPNFWRLIGHFIK